MKKTLLLLALISAGASAQAQNFAQGDLLLDFNSSYGTGVGTEVVFDLGAMTQTGLSSFASLDESGAGSLLSTTFGSNWYSSGNVNWMAASASLDSANSRTAYISSGASLAVPPKTTSQAVNALYGDLTATYANGSASGVTTGTEGGFNYYTIPSASGQAGTFAAFENSVWSSSVNSSMGVSVTGSDSITLNGYDRLGNTYSSVVSINNASGAITAGAVPEPSTYALMGFGALVLVIAYRRKSNA